jgi:hypothetical protein
MNVYWGICVMITTAETLNTRSKVCSSAIFFHKKILLWPGIKSTNLTARGFIVHKYNLQYTLNKCKMYFCIIIKVVFLRTGAGIARSVLRLATGSTIWESNLAGVRFKGPFLGPTHPPIQCVDCVWNVMAHAQKPDFVFRRNGRVHLNRRGRQFWGLLAAEVCVSTVVMLDTPCSEVVWRVLATQSIREFPLHFLSRASPCAITFQLDSTALLLAVRRLGLGVNHPSPSRGEVRERVEVYLYSPTGSSWPILGWILHLLPWG